MASTTSPKVPVYSVSGTCPRKISSQVPNHVLRLFPDCRREDAVIFPLLSSTNNPSSLCPDLKNTTDDALMPYLTTLPEPYKFTINNSNSNVRLILGYSAVTIAGT